MLFVIFKIKGDIMKFFKLITLLSVLTLAKFSFADLKQGSLQIGSTEPKMTSETEASSAESKMPELTKSEADFVRTTQEQPGFWDWLKEKTGWTMQDFKKESTTEKYSTAEKPTWTNLKEMFKSWLTMPSGTQDPVESTTSTTTPVSKTAPAMQGRWGGEVFRKPLPFTGPTTSTEVPAATAQQAATRSATTI
jgi:hypothetical protein